MIEGVITEKDFNENQNFPIKVGEKVYWHSRAMAVVGFVFKEMGNRLFVLTEQRGAGAADNVGSFCVPCGYLDFNETLEDAILRELKEETGFVGIKNKLNFLKINSNPTENRQNVSVHFSYFADENEEFSCEKAIGGEKDEISYVGWMYIGDVKKVNLFKKIFTNDKKDCLKINHDYLNQIKWAFNHNLRIEEHISKYYKIE